MSESVDILIKADDQASKEFDAASTAMAKSTKRVERIVSSLETNAEKYNRQLEELAELHRQGAISADQFAAAEERLQAKIEGNENAFKEIGGQAKITTEFVGTLAALSGNSQIASLAGQMASATEKVSQFSEVSKAGKAGALGFKLGLIGLAASIGFGIGKALGDIIFQTEKFERAMEDAKEEARALDEQVRKVQANIFANAKEDIELIRDPEEKRAAYKKLFDDLNRDIDTAGKQVEKSKREVEEWADSWKITGNQKAYAEQAEEQLQIDRDRLAALKEQRDEINKLISVRAQENEEIRKANEAKDKSESYIESLKQEIEYLGATREEQIKLDALRNTTDEDRSEAERLLRERDAINAKLEAERELAQLRKQEQEELVRAAEKAEEDARRKAEKAKELEASIREANELRRIEIEQGKEAARVQALVNKGLSQQKAEELAAEEKALDALQKKEDKGKPKDAPGLRATEGRLLTRGNASQANELAARTAQAAEQMVRNWQEEREAYAASNAALEQIKTNTSNTTQLVPTT